MFSPRPKLPSTHSEYMETGDIPDQYTKTADKEDFIIFKDWVDEAKTECMVMFMLRFSKITAHGYLMALFRHALSLFHRYIYAW